MGKTASVCSSFFNTRIPANQRKESSSWLRSFWRRSCQSSSSFGSGLSMGLIELAASWTSIVSSLEEESLYNFQAIQDVQLWAKFGGGGVLHLSRIF